MRDQVRDWIAGQEPASAAAAIAAAHGAPEQLVHCMSGHQPVLVQQANAVAAALARIAPEQLAPFANRLLRLAAVCADPLCQERLANTLSLLPLQRHQASQLLLVIDGWLDDTRGQRATPLLQALVTLAGAQPKLRARTYALLQAQLARAQPASRGRIQALLSSLDQHSG